jgi:menaquinone-dependent protoporphyrinogen IX oxidase
MSSGLARVMVAYATAGSEGQTERIAARLAEALRGEGARVDVIDSRRRASCRGGSCGT